MIQWNEIIEKLHAVLLQSTSSVRSRTADILNLMMLFMKSVDCTVRYSWPIMQTCHRRKISYIKHIHTCKNTNAPALKQIALRLWLRSQSAQLRRVISENCHMDIKQMKLDMVLMVKNLWEPLDYLMGTMPDLRT